MTEPMPCRTDRAPFDRLFAEGAAAVADGSHRIEVPPGGGSRRWGVSALLRPDPGAEASLAELAREAAVVAGDGHWLTGAVGNSHLTMRALEYPRADIRDDDPCVARYAKALSVASAGVPPLAFDIFGLTLTPLSVMACALPVDDAPDRLSAAYAAALGDDAWLEDGIGLKRDIWYLNILHFAAPVGDPRALIDWVADRRDLTPIPLRATEVEIATWRFTGSAMKPLRLAASVLR
ncbi:hypothetical protein KGQ19_06510 [Catenulispora sp. NL8]|uniref:Uncharacterized protein n=1 Tax=Catenulispora pinistramenti TaxID=2705254 RepID=A0ABS5KJE8_9ACTN|nr:hypothetical protein [Catenulispora pinistramenti]MBS2546513.1 hypothetical protein [Catenulispora pinistramenti]